MTSTDKDIKFRRGYLMGLRRGYIVISRENLNQEDALKELEECHDELIDKYPNECEKIRDFPGLSDIWEKWNAPHKQADKGRAKKRS